MIRKKTNGEEHPEVAGSYHNLAFDYRKLGQHNEAKECDEKALIIRKTIYGEEHPEVAASYYNLAYDHRKLGQHNEAKECNEKALIIRKKIYGEQHPKVAASYYKIYVEEHPDIAATSRRMTFEYSGLKEQIKAKEHKEKAGMITRKIYHFRAEESSRQLSVDSWKLEEHKKTKKYGEKALTMRQRTYDRKRTVVASSSPLALDYRKSGKHNTEMEDEKTESITRKDIYGEEHSDASEGNGKG